MTGEWQQLILIALESGNLHAHAIRLEIERQTNDKKSPTQAELFSALGDLLDSGSIERSELQLVRVGDRTKLRRVYSLSRNK